MSEPHRNLVQDLSTKATTRAFNNHGFAVEPYSEALSLLDSIRGVDVLYSHDDEGRHSVSVQDDCSVGLRQRRLLQQGTQAFWPSKTIEGSRPHLDTITTCGIHSHFAFLKRTYRNRQIVAISPSTTRYP